MPQTEPGGAGKTKSKKETQQAANTLEAEAKPAVAKEQEAQEFLDLTPGSPPEGVELQDPRMAPESVPGYADEDEEFLYGMTDRPDEPLNFGVNTLKAQPPKHVYRYLSALAEAAEDPNAPPQVHAFIRVLNDMLSED
jgi:hypothetical protein